MDQVSKTIISIDLGAATLRLRLSRFMPGYPLHTLGEVALPLDSLANTARDIAPEEVLAGPKRLLEASSTESVPGDTTASLPPMFCPNSSCGLARRPWPPTATVCALCRTRLVPRTAIVAEELVGHAIARGLFELHRTLKRPPKPDMVLASTPIDWRSEIRYRYLDFLKTAFPGGDVRLIDDPIAIARDAAESPDLWKIPGIVSGDRVLVIDSGARRTQFYTAVSSPRIGFFDAAYAVEEWGGADCDHLIASTVAAHLGVECDPAVESVWARSIRLWKETLSDSFDGSRVTVTPLHLPIGTETAETLAVGPPARDTAAILDQIEKRVGEVVDSGLRALGDISSIATVLVAGGNARWPYFEAALRSALPDAVIAPAPPGRPAVLCGLPCTLLADTLAWKLNPTVVEEELRHEAAVVEVEAKRVPTISELFASPTTVDAEDLISPVDNPATA